MAPVLVMCALFDPLFVEESYFSYQKLELPKICNGYERPRPMREGSAQPAITSWHEAPCWGQGQTILEIYSYSMDWKCQEKQTT